MTSTATAMTPELFTLSVEAKARLFDQEQKYQEALNAAKFQLFRVCNEGRWMPVLAQSCAPDTNGADPRRIVAIIDGEPHPAVIRANGQSKSYFSEDDFTVVYHFEIVANGIVVGECSFEEY